MDIKEQLEWERSMVALGIARFRGAEDKAVEGKRYTDTSAGGHILRSFLGGVSDAINEYVNVSVRGSKNKHWKLLRGVDCDKLAMFTLHAVVETLFVPQSITRVARNIGNAVEDELRFSMFEIEKPQYYKAILRDLDKRNSTQYRHRHRVLVKKMNDEQIEWTEWSGSVKVGVGLLLLSLVEENSDLIERVNVKEGRGNTRVMVAPTQATVDWVVGNNSAAEMSYPDRMPCIIKPARWEDWQEGGYYSHALRKRTPVVKTRRGEQRTRQAEMLDSATMPTVLNSINAMQDTGWRINERLLSCIKEVWETNAGVGMPNSQPYEIRDCPIAAGKKPTNDEERVAFEEWKAEARTIHAMETERKAGLMAVHRAVTLASRLDEYSVMHIVFQMDFRSRAYSTTSGVSPQGSDPSKALLEFAQAEALETERGVHWWKLQGANKYGNDKGTHTDRLKWVRDNHDFICEAGSDPLAHTDVWGSAEKPWQFLAWCIEYADAHRQLRAGYIRTLVEFSSRLPIAMDGACNGLQHFSAMLRDNVGGSAVNLVPSDTPADIYQEVADVCTSKVREIARDAEDERHIVASNWLALFDKLNDGRMDRKASKKPVMTLPYGSTRQTCTQALYEWYLDQEIDFFPKNTAFKHCNVLSGLLWQSIGEVVVAARSAMSWIQNAASLLAKSDEPVVYTTPVGFPMVQHASKTEKHKVDAQIGGRLSVTVYNDLPGISVYKARSGSSPNLVHSIDATHMHMVVEAGYEAGIRSFAMIHDDFGVPARWADTWARIIREQFIKLYTENDILEDFKRQQEERTGIELPPVPTKGSLDINLVAKSLFFFD